LDQRQAALEGWLRFNDEDVALNRDGRLSPRQRRRLIWSAAWRLVVGPAAAVVAAVIAAVNVDTVLAVLLALSVVIVGLYLSWIGFAFMVDATSDAVAFVTARLGTHVVRGRSTTYFADVGPIHKPISRKAFSGLEPAVGATYHLYYAPGCRSLLSMEPASATEPRPAHAFGPDSAHAWDRLRWSWILLTVGVFGALLGAHQIAAAHPAIPIKVAGLVQDYVEYTTTGRGAHTERSFYLAGDGNVYTPDAESAYTPEPPEYHTFIGRQLILYVDQGTTDVIALSDGDTLYAADWYLHPEHETTHLLINGVLSTAVGVALLVLGFVLLLRDRRLAEEMPGRPVVYVPPSVHPVSALWPALGLFAGVVAFLVLAIVSSK
jgi:hypothetical protein